MENSQDCEKVLEWLRRGNKKHEKECQNQGESDSEYSIEMKLAAPGQKPRAAILSCADSRVIPEQIFGAGIGELFVVRIAGNVASEEAIASLEYAVAKLGVQVILVMGHEACGAVEAALELVEKRKNPGSFHLDRLLSYILPAVNDPNARNLKNAVLRNADIAATALLQRSKILHDAYHRQENPILICSVYYQLSGEVEWPLGCNCRNGISDPAVFNQ